MNEIILNYTQLHYMADNIISKIKLDNWIPEYIVGISKGGLLPAILISNYYDIPLYTIKISFDNDGNEYDCDTNSWMASDAFDGKNMLIINSINNTGKTISWLKNNWESECLPNSDKWEKIWHNNVKFAAIACNLLSKETIDYNSFTIDQNKEVLFPWQN
jgi:hypoxanthine phosphoribosyltransferase